MEIVISGAFPDNNETHQQCLTDALILFEKEILTQGYDLTFGAHPTFQELFYQVGKKTCPESYKDRLNMYISNFFIKEYGIDTSEFADKFKFNPTDNVEGDQVKSLTQLRKEMIARDTVKALVCLGGKVSTDSEKHDGIREEIDIARAREIPVFIVGSVGGCSSIVAKEYQAKNWEGLNEAEPEVNEMFMNSLDYREMAKALIKYIEEK